MENYRELFRLVVSHDYDGNEEGRAFACALTPQGQALAQRRSLCFRQLSANEWALYYQARPTVSDDLSLSLSCTDCNFPLYTRWDGFVPSGVYEIELPSPKDVEADEDFVLRQGGRGFGEGLCSMLLHLDNALYDAADAGNPMRTTIHFKALSARWTYLFIPRRDREFPAEQMRLEDENGQLCFCDCVDDAERPGAVSTASQDAVPLCRKYDCKLRLVASDVNGRKIVLLSDVAPPEPGRFLDAPQGTLHSICYY